MTFAQYKSLIQILCIVYRLNVEYNFFDGFICLTQNRILLLKHVCLCAFENVVCDFLYRWKDHFSSFIRTMSVFSIGKSLVFDSNAFLQKNIFISNLPGIICRPAILSIPYLLFLFYIPFLSARDHTSFYSHARNFFKYIVFTTFTIVLSQFCVHMFLLTKNLQPLATHGGWGQFLHNVGFVELYKPE